MPCLIRLILVEISIVMNASPGLKGFVERVVIPIAIPSVLRKELKLLEAVAQKRGTPLITSNQSH
jgi:hypothetical protein